MTTDGENQYFDAGDPIREYLSSCSQHELNVFGEFLEAVSDEEMQSYLLRAFDVALEKVKLIGPVVVGNLPNADKSEVREILDELFKKIQWRISRQIILDDFHQASD